MIMTMAGFMGGLGLACMIYRKTFLGVLIGVQLLILGSTLILVLAGIHAGLALSGYVFGLLITLGGVAQLVVGYTLATRLFFLKNSTHMSEMRNLKK